MIEIERLVLVIKHLLGNYKADNYIDLANKIILNRFKNMGCNMSIQIQYYTAI